MYLSNEETLHWKICNSFSQVKGKDCSSAVVVVARDTVQRKAKHKDAKHTFLLRGRLLAHSRAHRCPHLVH